MVNFLSYLIPTTLRMGTPIAYTTLGGLVSERSGVVNIGLEGIMVASAFGAVVGSYASGSPWVGVLVGVLIGIFIAAIHSLISIYWGGNQSVSSMALILMSTGLSGVGLMKFFQTQGSSPQVVDITKTPFLAGIPVVGPTLANLSPLVYLLFLCYFLVFWIFKYSKWGLRITTVGENPKVAETAGISVQRIRLICVLASGLLGGLGGSYLSLGQMNMYQEGMVAGRGYLALAAVTMGRWNPTGAFLSALFFGMFDAIQLYIQTIPNIPIPGEFVQMLPYAACVVVLVITSSQESSGIAASGKPFSKFVVEK